MDIMEENFKAGLRMRFSWRYNAACILSLDLNAMNRHSSQSRAEDA